MTQIPDKISNLSYISFQAGASVAAFLLCPFCHHIFSHLFCYFPIDFFFADFLDKCPP